MSNLEYLQPNIPYIPWGKILPGQVFGRWTTVSRADNASKGHSQWLCRCECGNEGIVRSMHLKRGGSMSCGCLHAERGTETHTVHGACANGEYTTEYKIWQSMMNRCNNPKNSQYYNYGGRGITVCEEWSDFQVFLSQMGFRPSKEYSLDRIDNSMGYSKSNCKWSTRAEQSRNKRSNIVITVNGETGLAIDFAKDIGLAKTTIYGRVKKGWPLDETILQPPKTKKAKVDTV